MSATQAGVNVGTVTRLPIERVHPDPLQPRKNADAELKDSILHNGQQQPITVYPHITTEGGNGHFQILDGERRYRGCLAAGLTDIDCIITDAPPKATRLIRQVSANTGKPLTPIEEAFAYKQIMTDNKWSQNELSKRLGIPRSTVGDRIRMIELHPAWLELIEQGKLQIAHAAIIHRFRDVPEQYHEKAVERALSDKSYKIGWPIKNGEVVQVNSSFASDLFSCYSQFLRELKDVPGYEGPTVKVARFRYDYANGVSTEKEDGYTEYAADPKLWKPILNKIKKERIASGVVDNTHRNTSYTPDQVRVVKAYAKAHGLDVVVQKEPQYGEKLQLPEGAEVFWKERGFSDGIDARCLLDHIDPQTVTPIVAGYHSLLATTDTEAVVLARQAWSEKREALTAGYREKAKQVFDAELEQFQVFGLGARQVLAISDRRDEGFDIAGLTWIGDVIGVKVGDLFKTEVTQPEPLPWRCAACEENEPTVRSTEKPDLCTACVAEGCEDEWEEGAFDRPAVEEVVLPEDADQDSVETLAAAWLMVQTGHIDIPSGWDIEREMRGVNDGVALNAERSLESQLEESLAESGEDEDDIEEAA